MNNSRQMKLLYGAAFAQAFILWYAVEKLFMRQIGFTDATTALSVAIMTAVVLVAETPSGIIADRWSRKGVLLLSNLALIIATITASFSTSILTYTIALVFLGVYFALFSGIYDSIIYDTSLEKDGDSRRYKKRYGIFQVVSGIALVSSSIIGSFVGAVMGLEWSYWLTIPFSLASCVLLFFFNEPKLHKKSKHSPLSAYISGSFRKLITPDVWRLALAMIIVGVVMGMQFNFGQLWYIAVAMPVLLFGPAYAALQACLAFGGIAADKVRLSTVQIAAVFAFGMIALTIPNSAVIIAGQITLQTMLIILMIWLSGSIHDQVNSGQRSGINSAVSTCTKIISLPAGLLFGFVSQEFSVFSTPIIMSVLLCGLIVLFYRINKKTPLFMSDV